MVHRAEIDVARSRLARQVSRTWSLAVATLACLLACSRGPIQPEPDGPTVDAELYATGFCSLKCYRLAQCGLADEADHEACEDACIDDAVESLPGDPCWAEWIEARRCRVRETTCDGVADENPPDPPVSLCEHRESLLDQCEL